MDTQDRARGPQSIELAMAVNPYQSPWPIGTDLAADWSWTPASC